MYFDVQFYGVVEEHMEFLPSDQLVEAGLDGLPACLEIGGPLVD